MSPHGLCSESNKPIKIGNQQNNRNRLNTVLEDIEASAVNKRALDISASE
jgi:hypothetical protein